MMPSRPRSRFKLALVGFHIPDFFLISGSLVQVLQPGPVTRVTCRGNQDSPSLSTYTSSRLSGPNENGRKANSPKTKDPPLSVPNLKILLKNPPPPPPPPHRLLL